MNDITVNVSGPLFDGRAQRAAHAAVEDAAEAVAQEAYDTVTRGLHASLRHPTGYYESRVHINRVSTTRVVTDSGVVYGPWLEGTGSRNRTTRFKGYFTFRKARQRIETRAAAIAEPAVARRVREMQ